MGSYNFIDDQGIELFHLGKESNLVANPWNTISEDMVISALKLILDPKNYPLSVMCNLGRHRTGTLPLHLCKKNIILFYILILF